jgi:hypothetical protein
MPTKLDLRPITSDEARASRTLAASRTGPVRHVQRAKLLVTMLDDLAVSGSVAGHRAGLNGQSGCA